MSAASLGPPGSPTPGSADPPGPPARYPRLQSPLRLGGLLLPHRILTGSMHLNLETGDASALAEFYAERARGGAALMITGGAAVNRAGAGGPGYALINEPGHWARWRQVTDAVHAAGGLIGLQLFHAGRYAFESSFGLRPVAPSAVYSAFSRCEPEPMSAAGIEDTIADFAAGAARAGQLGFDAVEIMASEGYLLNQFASPLTNQRTDEWGGDARRRRAFPTAVTAAVRTAAGSLPVLVRISGTDLVPGSSAPEEVDALAVELVRSGADAIDVGIGWHEARIPTVQSLVPHGVWAGTAGRIRSALHRADAAASRTAVPVITSNRVNSLAQAEAILAAGQADMVSMARPFLADPQLIRKSLSGRESLVNTCIGCNEACIDRSLGMEAVSCLVNPRAGRELEFPLPPTTGPTREPEDGAARRTDGTPGAAVRRRIGVIGAGPAGMEAARALAANGAAVTLWEAGPRIGGQFLMAGLVPGKADFLETIRYFEHELARLGVQIELDRPVVSADMVAGFDHIVVAAGVLPRKVNLAGSEPGLVIDYPEAFARRHALGRRIAVVGAGGIAVDLAHLLAEPQHGPAQPGAGAGHNIVTRHGAGPCGPTNTGTGDGIPGSAELEHRRFLVRHGLADGLPARACRDVTIMRRSGPIGAGMGITTRWAVVQEIRAAGVRTLTNVAYERIDPEGVWILREGSSELIPADTVVIAAGQVPNTGPADMLAAAGVPHTVIGGALEADGLNAVAAFEQGLRVGTALSGSVLPAP